MSEPLVQGPGVQYDSLLYYFPGFPNAADTVVYRLVAVSPLGCADTATAAVRVLPSPVFSFPSFLNLKCPADTLRIVPTGLAKGTPPYFFEWSGPAGAQSNWSEFALPNAQPVNAGRYFLTVSDVNGCSTGRNLQVTVPDSCIFKLTILGNGAVNCSGGELQLSIGTNPVWETPDEVEWHGPNGFFSKNLYPILKNTDPSMTGWYHLKARYGNSFVVPDSAYFEFSSQIFKVEKVEITPPTDCFMPFDGIVEATMSEPPPYQYAEAPWSGWVNFTANPITFSGVSASNFFQISVKKNGCWAKQYVVVPAPQPPVFQIENETCTGGDGKITVASPNPLSVYWTLPNGVNVNGQSVLNPAPAGFYKIGVKDLTTNCQFNEVVEVKPYLDFEVVTVDTPACTGADGSLLATALGQPVPPVAFEWSNGFAGNLVEGLAAGGYSVTMSDGDGCRRHKNTVLTADEACIALVSGRVFANLDCSCQPSAANLMFPSVRVCASQGSFSTCTFADNFGNYQLALTEAGDYLLEATTWLPNAQPACTQKTITLLDATTDQPDIDFYFCGEEKADLRTAVFCGTARPGFEQNLAVEVQNVGFWKADTSVLTVRFSPVLSILHISPPPTSFDAGANEGTWVIPKLAVFEKFTVKIVGEVLANLGDTMALRAEIKSLKTPDDFPTNDADECSTLVAGSFDPNDKQVEPLGTISVFTDSVLTYTIRFQNTGTDTAFSVVVRDTLDRSVFDPSTVEPLLSSHPFRLDLEAGHILVFKFDPILLPDSSRNRVGSEGFVSFRVKLKKGLPALTSIRNSAAIYFDFNAPVITNSTENQISKTAEPTTTDRRPILTFAPNPARQQGDCQATIRLPQPASRLVLTLENSDRSRSRLLAFFEKPQSEEQVKINLHGLPAGVYFVRAASEWGAVVSKLVVFGD